MLSSILLPKPTCFHAKVRLTQKIDFEVKEKVIQ